MRGMVGCYDCWIDWVGIGMGMGMGVYVGFNVRGWKGCMGPLWISSHILFLFCLFPFFPKPNFELFISLFLSLFLFLSYFKLDSLQSPQCQLIKRCIWR